MQIKVVTTDVCAVQTLAYLAFNAFYAPKCTGSSQAHSKLAANLRSTLELKTEEWVSG